MTKNVKAGMSASTRKKNMEMLDSTPTPVVVLDTNLCIIGRNNGFKNLINTIGVVSKSIFDIIPDLKSSKVSIEKVLKSKKEHIETIHTLIDSKELFLKLIMRFWEFGTTPAIIIHIVDKTEAYIQKIENDKLLRDLKKLNKTLKETNNAQAELMGIIAHDLKNQFNAIIGIIGLLDGNDLSDLNYIKELIGYLKSASDSALSTLVDLTEWYNMFSEKLSCSNEYFNLSYVVNSIISRLEPTAQQKSIHIKSEIQISIEVYADINMIKSVVNNLLINAIKFSHEKSDIIITNEIIDNYVKVSVIDTGIGMPDYVAKQLFDGKRNKARVGTNKEKGTGLGLAYAKKFIEACGGEINVSSQEGEGSIFSFTIPLGETKG